MHSYYRAILFIYVSSFFAVSPEFRLCGGLHHCCAGYKWNKEKKSCTECEIGYFGPNCTKQCKPPSFGRYCQSLCNCSINYYCHHANGCIQHYEAEYKQSTIRTNMNRKTTENDASSTYSSSSQEAIALHKHSSKSSIRCKDKDTKSNNPINSEQSNSITVGIICLLAIAGVLVFIYIKTYFVRCQYSNRTIPQTQRNI